LAEVLHELSSKFFELIPYKENENQPAAPIRNINIYKRHSDLIEVLLSVEYSSRILLGALYRQYEVNPIEYIYDCMAAKIALMHKRDPETILIRDYCINTAGSDLKNIRIFRIERKGEAEKFAPFKNQHPRMLLFHGSAMSNYLGILSQGLRIAPPEAPTTGYMFGKGVYFADMFRKSDAYAHGITSKVLILCEVALGQMKKLYEAKYIENLERPFLSVKGCGRNGPDLRNKLVVTPSGFSVPTGLPIKYPDRPAQ
jgi:poly [ADP-ribose] polymerase